MKAIYITATDTEAGKTVITGLLARYLQEKGLRVITQKWIQTGSPGFSTDVKLHLKIMGRSKESIKDYLDFVCPYTFRLPASPHLASEVENRKISVTKITRSFRLLCQEFDFVIVEGIGGVLVPVNKRCLVIDIVKELDLPVLLVVKNRLGAINHTLLSIEAIRSRGLKMLGVIFNNLKGENPLILKDNPKIINELAKVKILGVLPWQKNIEILYRKFVPIAEELIP